MNRRCAAELLAAMALGLLGCSTSEIKQVPLVRVKGVVTFDGKPLRGAVVMFESPDGSFSYAQTDRRGRYDLRFDSNSRGTTPGMKAVRISMNRRIHGLNSNDEGGPGDRAGGAFKKQPAEVIPERYHLRSVLAVEVTTAATRFDFELKS